MRCNKAEGLFSFFNHTVVFTDQQQHREKERERFRPHQLFSQEVNYLCALFLNLFRDFWSRFVLASYSIRFSTCGLSAARTRITRWIQTIVNLRRNQTATNEIKTSDGSRREIEFLEPRTREHKVARGNGEGRRKKGKERNTSKRG